MGVTHECDHPPEALRLPRLTSSALPTDGATPAAVDRHIRRARHEGSSIYSLDGRLLEELRPELVVTQELCDVCAVAYQDVERAARRLGGDVSVISLEPDGLEAICSTVVALGNVTGHRRAAELVAGSMSERIAVVGAMTAPRPRPVVACLEWTDPPMAGGHWVPEMVELAGGEDPLGVGGRPSRRLTWEEVLDARPDVMVLMPCGLGLERTLEVGVELASRPGFADLPCARSGRVVAVDGSSYFNRPGPRIVTGLEILAVAIRSAPGGALPKGAGWLPVAVGA